MLRRNELLALLRELVDIPSGSYDVDGVDRVGAILMREWSAIGFSCETRALPGFGAQRVFDAAFRGVVGS